MVKFLPQKTWSYYGDGNKTQDYAASDRKYPPCCFWNEEEFNSISEHNT